MSIRCTDRFEKECGVLQKDGKAYLDSMRGMHAPSPSSLIAQAQLTALYLRVAMSSAQLRLAETIDTFYSASDKTSDSAMAAHAYRRSVEELDAGIGRELVRYPFAPSIPRLLIIIPLFSSR